jgi:hypothetical protein
MVIHPHQLRPEYTDGLQSGRAYWVWRDVGIRLGFVRGIAKKGRINLTGFT